MAVSVSVGVEMEVLEGRLVSAKITTGVNVGVKKRVAKASRVNALSRGVGVAVCRGSRTMSGRVSGFPPLIMKGRLNARATVPRIARIIKEPLAFVFIIPFSIHQYNRIVGGFKAAICVHFEIISSPLKIMTRELASILSEYVGNPDDFYKNPRKVLLDLRSLPINPGFSGVSQPLFARSMRSLSRSAQISCAENQLICSL